VIRFYTVLASLSVACSLGLPFKEVSTYPTPADYIFDKVAAGWLVISFERTNQIHGLLINIVQGHLFLETLDAGSKDFFSLGKVPGAESRFQ
jgi:hypothetical protein